MNPRSPGSEPLISVVIPAFDVEDYIAEAITSVLGQSVRNIEIIVVNDGSQDGTEGVVKTFSDPRLSLLNKQNGGCASARNTGVTAAHGTFVSFLDADDFWEVDKLQQELTLLNDDPGLDMVFSLSYLVNESGQKLGLLNPVRNHDFSRGSLIIENPIGNGSAVLMKKSVFDEVGLFDESLAASSDIDMWIRVAANRPGSIACVPKILTHYRRRSTQTTASRQRMALAFDQVIEKLRQSDPDKLARLEPRARSNKYRYHAYIAFEAGKLKEATELLWKSMQACPGHFLLDSRSWLMGFTLMSGAVLPQNLHGKLFRYALGLREKRFLRKSCSLRDHKEN